MSGWDVRVYIHNSGDEFWLGVNLSPLELASIKVVAQLRKSSQNCRLKGLHQLKRALPPVVNVINMCTHNYTGEYNSTFYALKIHSLMYALNYTNTHTCL